MPSTSEAQHKAMEAASHGHSTLGIPASVGKEFVNADAAFTESDHPRDSDGKFGSGGGSASPAETRSSEYQASKAKKKELETHANVANKTLQSFPKGPMGMTPDDVKKSPEWISAYNAYESAAKKLRDHNGEHFKKFKKEANAEPRDYGRRSDSEDDEKQLPENELDIARKIQSGELPSPQHFGNVWLFDIRITGTGVAYRSKGDEFAFRSPDIYMNDEFLARCNGLQVIYQHPDKGTLNSKEFKERSIGAIFLPYLKHKEEEVWGIAKIYDDDAAHDMIKYNLSTSPTVVGVGNKKIIAENGQEVLIEGNPRLLDHVAICNLGVWDKGGDPSGVVSDSVTLGVDSMTEEELKAKADAEDKAKEEAKAKADADLTAKFDAMMTKMDSIGKRIDAMEEAKPREVVADKKSDSEKEEEKAAKADAEAKAKADAEETKARIDAVEKAMPKEISDADFEAMADAQSKADSVASMFGESASRPQAGESVLGYRKRQAAKFKKHSSAFKDIDITAISDSALFSVAEKQIYADAMTAANNPVLAEGEGLREIKTRSAAGHQISTFKGNIASWMDSFKADAFKLTQLGQGAK